jgi:hypothetical protein
VIARACRLQPRASKDSFAFIAVPAMPVAKQPGLVGALAVFVALGPALHVVRDGVELLYILDCDHCSFFRRRA